MQKQLLFILLLTGYSFSSFSQLQWKNVDSLYKPLPNSIHVYFTNTPIDTTAFRAFYVIADLKDRKLQFETDTSHNRRLTPSEFYQREQHPLLIVNGTFFSFETNQNLNLVVNDGKILATNNEVIRGRGKDSLILRHIKPSAIGITKSRKADVAWTSTASFKRRPYAY